MKLDFLKNTQQRLATGRRLPVKPLECIIMYGTPEQRYKAVQKTIPHAFGLCLNAHTSHTVISLAKHGGRTAVVELLFALRKKLQDLSKSHHGNVVIQEMIANLPKRQQQEIAQEFVADLVSLSTHQSANRVMQRLMTLPAAREELEEEMKAKVNILAVHPMGQHVVAKWLEHSEMQVEAALEVLSIPDLFTQMAESAVLTFLVASSATTMEKRQEIFDIAVDNAEDLVEHDKHSFLLAHIFQHAPTEETRTALFEALKPVLSTLVSEKKWCHVAAAMVLYCLPEQAVQVVDAVGGDWSAAVSDASKTHALRAWCESGMPGLSASSNSTGRKSAGGKKEAASPIASRLSALLKDEKQLTKLIENPISSPFLQRLVEHGTAAHRIQVYKAVAPYVADYANHTSAAYLLQALLKYVAADGVDEACLAAKTDLIDKLLASPSGLIQTIIDRTAPGKAISRTAQAALHAGASYEQLKQVTKCIISNSAHDLALDANCCYLVSATILELHARGEEMLEQKRALLNQLKPSVFSLALSPWAGRIVLDAMFQSSSKELTEAIKNVIYMKADFWLSDGGVASEGKSRKTERSDPDRAGIVQEEEAGRVVKKARKELEVTKRQQSLANNKAKTKTKLTHK